MRARRQVGFTLVELLVSTVLLTLVLLVAIQALTEAGRMLSRAQVEFAEPSMELATQWLRRDVQGASDVGRLAFLATSDPLELLGLPEGALHYEKVGANLDRVLVGTDGEEVGRRTVLRGVSKWRWRALGAGLVEIEIVYQRRIRTLGTRRGGSPVSLKEMSEQRWFALRNRQRGFW